ncbi:MAG: glycosyltransferase family 2 protein [Bacteroidales bacterium]|nr:glycosyltransferase family 2 protein [Bacteroidales bacterium]
MDTLQKISIIVPAYNEENAIRFGLEKFINLNFHTKYEIIYIDDGSTDKTAEIIREFPVQLYQHNINKGYGAALKTGIRKATGDKVIILDSDGQHDPKYIDQLIEMLNDFDMVIGERTSGSLQVKRRQAGKKLIRVIGEYMVEQKLPDYNSGFRGFNREIIKGMLHLMPNGFSFSTTSTLAFLKEGFTIGTFPIKVDERIGRKSNVKFVKDGTKTMLLIFRIIMLFNPLKIFFPASIIFTMAGLGFGTYGYIIASRFSNSAILLTTLGMFLFFIGLIADQISLLNRR